jgi:formate hydrogenlyase subunit 3/multisubunit Na+/H+ antiporter MnhD subunit
MLGSLFYLLGVALLYHSFGSVDIAILAQRVEPSPAVWAAVGLMSAALLLKTALFPLHFWLPPAHASAPAPVSALLSALVVKASFYILLRLWLEIFPPTGAALGQLFGLLGSAAVLWGGVQALRQTRLKLLIAYSTVTQLGYLFLAFPLGTSIAWKGSLYLLLSHALAKAAMFMAAGNILRCCGHDRIVDLDRVAQRLPLTLTAFALAGVSSMGLPPSGGFIGKWMLLDAALRAGQWWWGIILILGGLLAAAYVFKVIGYAFTQAEVPQQARTVPITMEWTALALALAAILLGLFALGPLALMEIGLPFGGESAG